MRRSLPALAAVVGSLLACSGSADIAPTAPSAPLAGAGTASSPHVSDCWTTASQLGKGAGSTDYVACPAGCTSGMIWGTGRYTGDSRVCVAAVHAGVLSGASAGTAVVKLDGPAANFTGSQAHGVKSESWTSTQALTFTVSAAASAPAAPGEDPAGRGGKGGKQKGGKNH